MFKALLKSKLSAFFASFSGAGSNKKKKPQSPVVKVLLIILFVFLVGYLMFAFGAITVALDFATFETGEKWVSQTVAALMASLLCVIGSVFTVKTQIFESKDNELLLAMPIPPKYIFFSRIVMLLVVNYALEAMVLVPSFATHAVLVGYTFFEALCSLVVFILIPFFTISLSVFVAWIISIISSRVRNKTLVSVLFTTLFMGVYLFACGMFGAFAGASEEESVPTTVDFSPLKKTYLFYWMGSAMAEANILSLLYVVLCTVIPAVIVYWLLNRSFVKILTTNIGIKKIKYVEKEQTVSTPEKALFGKELKRLFTSSAYILNSGMGSIMTIIGAVMLTFLGAEILPIASEEPMIATFIPPVATMMIIFMSSMNIISAPSISLEDKSLWILQVAPIDPAKVLMAKIKLHLVVSAPCALIAIIIVAVALKFTLIDAILAIIATMAVVCLTAYFGLFLGLKFPKFDWQNETVAVKQGFAVFGSMLGSMLFAMILFAGAMILALFQVKFFITAIIITVVSAIPCVILHLYLAKNGARIFANLKH